VFEYHLRSTRLAAAELARAKIASESLTMIAAFNWNVVPYGMKNRALDPKELIKY